MGVFVGQIQWLDATLSTLAGLAACYNKITEAFTSVGCIWLPVETNPGRAGTFVDSSPGADETLVAPGTVTGYLLQGTNIFKHPSLDIYVRVRYYSFHYNTNSRFAVAIYDVGTSLVGGDLDMSTGKSSSSSTPSSLPTSAPTTLTLIPANIVDLYASCGPDHLWIYATADQAIQQVSSSANAPMPGKITFTGMAILSEEGGDGSIFAVISAPSLGAAPSSVAFNTQTLDSALGPACYQNWIFTDGVAASLVNGSLGSLPYPSASYAEGIRAAKMYTFGKGRQIDLDAGFICTASLVDGGLLNLNLSGEAVKSYRVAHAMGPCNPSFNGMIAATASSPLLPWNA